MKRHFSICLVVFLVLFACSCSKKEAPETRPAEKPVEEAPDGREGFIHAPAHGVKNLLDAYEETGETEKLNRAREAVDIIIKKHGADTGGFFGFEGGGDDGERPIAENAMMARNLIRIYYCAGGEKYKELAEKTLKILPPPESSGAPGGSLAVTSHLVRHYPLVIAIVGDKKDKATKALRKEALRFHEPRKIVLTLDPEEDKKRLDELPYVARPEPVLYACVENACSMPIVMPDFVEPQLRRFADKFLKKEK